MHGHCFHPQTRAESYLFDRIEDHRTHVFVATQAQRAHTETGNDIGSFGPTYHVLDQQSGIECPGIDFVIIHRPGFEVFDGKSGGDAHISDMVAGGEGRRQVPVAEAVADVGVSGYWRWGRTARLEIEAGVSDAGAEMPVRGIIA